MEQALTGFAARRDEEALPYFNWTQRLGALKEIPPPGRALLEGIAADQRLADRYCGVTAETVHPDKLFEVEPSTS